MKKYVCLLIILSSLIACSKKTIPSKTNNATIIYDNKDNGNVFASDSSAYKKTDSTAASVSNAASFLVISNGYGKIINSQQALPADANIRFNELQLSKGFSAQQLTNLKTRYNVIPPRVLYVNAASQLTSVRGNYFILKKKFWYWKKSDGLFYLDEKYYL